MADEVHDDPLGFEQDWCRSLDAGHLASACHGIAVGSQEGDSGFCEAHAFEDDGDERQTCHQGVLLGHNGRMQHGCRREEGFGGQVAAVLLQGEVHQSVQHDQPFVSEELEKHGGPSLRGRCCCQAF